jgi:hypothetical protein
MDHESGFKIHAGINELVNAGKNERSELLEKIVNGFLEGRKTAGDTAFYIGEGLLNRAGDRKPHQVSFDTDTSHGKFSAANSLTLLQGIHRLQGYIGAIKRWPEQFGIMDVGCGAFPILALAAALYHPRAEITGVEINQQSADISEQLVRLFGLSDRIKIVNADISRHKIDSNTTAAVTETFGPALQGEPGPQIVRLLSEVRIPIITPSRAELCLKMPQNKFFQKIDLRRDTHASITYARCGEERFAEDYYSAADITMAFYDDLGLFLPYDTDIITKGLPIGEKTELNRLLAKGPLSGKLTYELGSYSFEPTIE